MKIEVIEEQPAQAVEVVPVRIHPRVKVHCDFEARNQGKPAWRVEYEDGSFERMKECALMGVALVTAAVPEDKDTHHCPGMLYGWAEGSLLEVVPDLAGDKLRFWANPDGGFYCECGPDIRYMAGGEHLILREDCQAYLVRGLAKPI